MLAGRAAELLLPRYRPYSTALGPQPVPVLPDNSLETFRKSAFGPATPALLPRQSFDGFPSIRKWFAKSPNHANRVELDRSYLAGFGSTTVPLEISTDEHFTHVEQPLSFFLDAVAIGSPAARVYLAQGRLDDLPKGLSDDVPTPELVLKAGKGDIYDSSIWLGQAPTYTPLHRDPNENIFVQLAGKKVVRLFRPDVGNKIFAKVQEQIGGHGSATMRGEEMMQGVERKVLEDAVWNNRKDNESSALEAELKAGDGLFIPRGWWHSIKGVGEGMTGSVNWWFR